MKKTTEIAIELKKQVIRSCLGEMSSFFEGETITSSPCKPTLASLSVSMQQAICLRNNNAFAEGKPLNELLAKLVLQKIANQKMSPPQRQRTKAIMLKSMV